ncbi:class I SAM-dependent methyltransferase [Williamsia sp.]|uniref:class I SAM-dependent methyltransferase n=1 Tax=Williamsia sp. TaxID=1872085 RepID=UPI002F950236
MTDSDKRAQMSRSFGGQAQSYSRGRPDYPAAAVAELTKPDARVIADIGAGTGKLTASLLDSARTVYAVEPDAQMLDVLRAHLPTVHALIGTAEQIPLAGRTIDALVFGQAWHWVRPDIAAAEAARVLRPGGTLGMIWNIRDESVPWVKQLTDTIAASEAERYVAAGVPELGAGFGPLVHTTVRWDRTLSAAQLLDMVSSRSAVITATDTDRARILEQVEALAAEVSDEDGNAILPYATHVYRAELNP